MANADGGFILFGVKDRKYPVSSPDVRLEGLPLGADLRRLFGDKISDIQRELHFEAIPKPIVLPNDPTRGFFVVYIPPSPRRPHMVAYEGVFYRRGEGGTSERMAFYEVREQMLYTEERLQKVTLFRLQLAQYRRLEAVMKLTWRWDRMQHEYCTQRLPLRCERRGMGLRRALLDVCRANRHCNANMACARSTMRCAGWCVLGPSGGCCPMISPAGKRSTSRPNAGCGPAALRRWPMTCGCSCAWQRDGKASPRR